MIFPQAEIERPEFDYSVLVRNLHRLKLSEAIVNFYIYTHIFVVPHYEIVEGTWENIDGYRRN